MDIFKSENLSFKYSNNHLYSLKNINLSIPENTLNIICGKSGSGKTTLIKCLSNYNNMPGEIHGTIEFKQVPICKIPPNEKYKNIVYSLQDEEGLFLTDTVIDELLFNISGICISSEDAYIKIAEISHALGITELLNKNFCELSGGQKQIIRLSIMLMLKPQAIIIDGPLSGLDYNSCEIFINLLKRVVSDFSVTVIISVSSVEYVYKFADNIIFIDNGITSECIEVREWLNHPHTKENYEFFSLPILYRICSIIGYKSESIISIYETRKWFSEIFIEKNITHKTVTHHHNDAKQKSPLLILKDIWFKYQKNSPDILKRLNLQIGTGEVLSILGRNGSGKSTLLKIICKTIKPYIGNAFIDSIPIHKYKDNVLFNGIISAVPQNISTNYNCSNISTSYGKNKFEYIKSVLSKKSKIVILDEPTVGLDCIQINEIEKTIYELSKKGVSVIISSHNIEFCSNVSTKCCLMFDGQIIGLKDKNKFFSENTFYTTIPRLISQNVSENSVTERDVINLCIKNGVINS